MLKIIKKTARALIIAGFFNYHGSAQQMPVQDQVYRAVAEKLRGVIPEVYLQAAFAPERVAILPEIPERFAKPLEKKTWEEYRAVFITDGRIQKGIQFHNDNRDLIHQAALAYQLDEYVLIAILGIECNYGANTGQVSVFNSLYTQITTMPSRATWATGELAEFLTYCYADSRDPHSLNGSYAGAFGFGQFIPSSFRAYAVDFNKDGAKNPYDWADALGSVANYLRSNGFNSGSVDYSEKAANWKAIYAYNHSSNYVNAVLALREAIKKGVEATTID